jgi:hypothetical protein
MDSAHYIAPVRYSQSRFLNSAKKKRGRFNQAIKPGKPALKLFRELSDPFEPYFYSLRHHHLQLESDLAASKNLYDHKAIKLWKEHLKQAVDAPYFYKFEVGQNRDGSLGKLHVHLVADVDAGLLDIPRDGEIIKPIPSFEDYGRVMRYLLKPPVTSSTAGKAEYLKALIRIQRENTVLPRSKQRRGPPQVSGYVWE